MINTLAVVGATGAVGKIILEQIASRKFPAKNIKIIIHGVGNFKFLPYLWV